VPKILPAVACNLDPHILGACLPLLEESRVEALEWSFDALFTVQETPGWFQELLTAFSNEKRLIGHGVFFSLFSGKWLTEQAVWLKELARLCSAFQFDHITEHFGFMTGANFHQGAPLNIPFTSSTLSIGQDRLKRIYDACQCPVGLENLAFSYSLDEVKKHGEFLEQLLEPVNGFIILDLHNLWCQIHNFSISFNELIDLYPLHKVREIHISGGSWDLSSIDDGRMIRRDTHDDAVPAEVFRLLETAIVHCPHLKYVVLEQLGNGLETAQSKKTFYQDFLTMEKIARQQESLQSTTLFQSFLPVLLPPAGPVIEDLFLYQQQQELSDILVSAVSCEEARRLLNQSSLAFSAWDIEHWDPAMIETAIKIARKWKDGFPS
jgi:uncharacterized protein (UPF0276 family)